MTAWNLEIIDADGRTLTYKGVPGTRKAEFKELLKKKATATGFRKPFTTIEKKVFP